MDISYGSINESTSDKTDNTYAAGGDYVPATDWKYWGFSTTTGYKIQDSSFDGNGAYSITTSTTTRTGTVTQSSSNKSQTDFMLTDNLNSAGVWVPATGTSTTDGESKSNSVVAETGTFTQSVTAAGRVGTITGTTTADSTNSDESKYNTTASRDTEGVWTTSGTASGSGSSSASDSYSGSGGYKKSHAGGVIDGTIYVDAENESQSQYQTSATLSPGSDWVTTGSGSGSGKGHSYSSFDGTGNFLFVTKKITDPTDRYESSVSGIQNEDGGNTSDYEEQWTSAFANGGWTLTSGDSKTNLTDHTTYDYATEKGKKGTYHHWGSGAGGYEFDVNGTVTASGDTLDWSMTELKSAVVDGEWKTISGSGSGGSLFNEAQESSGSGTRSRNNPNFVGGPGSKGPTITGELNEFSSSESHTDSDTSFTLVNEKWVTTGTGSSSGKNKNHTDYTGDVGFSWSDVQTSANEITTFSGHFHEEGSNDSSADSDSKSSLADGKWTLVSGTANASSSSHQLISHSGSGTYQRFGTEEGMGNWKSSGDYSASGGSHFDESSESKSSVVDASWKQVSGSGSASGGNHGNRSGSGAGYFTSDDFSGTIKEGSAYNSNWEWDTESTFQPAVAASGSSSGTAARWTMTGSGSGFDNSSSNFDVTTLAKSDSYVEVIEGGTLVGTGRAYSTHTITDDSNYETSWDDSKSEWKLTSGSGEWNDKRGIGANYSGHGDVSLSGNTKDANGTINGSWSFSGLADKSGDAEAGIGSFSKSAVVDGKWTLVDEGTLTYANKWEQSSLKNGSGTFDSGALSGSYRRNSDGKWSWEWTIYDGTTGVTGDAKLTSSGSSSGDSDATGTISSRDTSGVYTYNDGFSGSDNTLVEYTFDSVSEQFLAKAGGKVSGTTSASADGNFDGTGQPESGSGSVTYHFDWKQTNTDTTTWTSASKSWQRTASGGGTYVANTDYKSSSSGSYVSKHGLTGDWTLTSKDDSNTDLNWTTAYSGGMQNDSGTGTLKGEVFGSLHAGSQRIILQWSHVRQLLRRLEIQPQRKHEPQSET